MDVDHIERLKKVGFVLDPLNAIWEERFTELLSYKESHGDCNVPQRWRTNPQLGKWVRSNRAVYDRGSLGTDRIERLEAIGFVWDQYEAKWDARFRELVSYKEIYGNCNVPRDWKENKQLSTWISTQRKAYKNGTLKVEHITHLEQIGFRWNILDALWDERIIELIAYKDKHGDCSVPEGWKKNPKLAIWVGTQRNNYKNGKIDAGRVERLEQIGFLWHPKEISWEKFFNELLAYKEKFGNCNVPNRWKENTSLGGWVANQRTYYKQRRLTKSRIERLTQIGFDWKTK